ncbi:glycosidase [bacterium]|nr:glycosidase [bacterium]
MPFNRSPWNPLIPPQAVKPSRSDFKVVCVFNAGVIRHHGQVLLLLRVAEKPIPTSPELELVPVYDACAGQITVKAFRRDDPECDFSDPRFVRSRGEQYLSSLSHIRLARSTDGIHFQVEDHPAMAPSNLYESYGIEDPRIVFIDGIHYIAYSAISPLGSAIALASTTDFISYDRHGIILCPDNRDVEIFPEKINGSYYALHRPNSGEYGRREIWLAESPDLLHWGRHRRVMGTREHFWDSGRVGGSTIPIRTERGWLEIYHGADQNNRYCLGAVLLDAEAPWRVLARSNQPLMQPEADYEVNGFFGNVLFTCGALAEEGKIKMYYGAADTSLCYAEILIADILSQLAGI